MPRFMKTGLLVVLFAYSIFLPTSVTANPSLALIIENSHGSRLISVPIEPGELFTIRYIHSVDISPVYEVFYADEKKGIVIKETRFKMFGAGMGHWEGRGRVTGEEGWIFIKDMNIAIGEFYLRIGAPAVDHTILIKEQEMHLSRMIPGMRVRIYIKQIGK
ncbi:MAG: DUF1850 domain-containing protein [Thermodesulfobacteriota bacterium]